MGALSEIVNCYIYILDTLADWEIGFVTAELNSGRYLSKDKKINLVLIGNTLAPVKTMGGISIVPDKDITDVDFVEGDLLVLPGADTWMEEKNHKIINLVKTAINKNVIVAAICGATLVLAQNGILDNRKHTSNDKDFLKMMCPDYRGNSFYIDDPVVTDNNLITATGLAPLEFAYEIFREMKVMKNDTLEAWYKLYKTRESKYFYRLIESLN